MFRELFVATTIAAAALALAPGASADPSNDYHDDPGRYSTDVPGMSYEAKLGAPCYSWQRNVFGRGRGGEPLQCKWIPNQWPPVQTGFWTTTYALYGVQDIGAPCPGPQSTAQAPDGRPLLCVGAQGWQPTVLTGNGLFPA
ncbi:hypothetical protein [Mycobacterium sp. GA-2829]|uniref:hypothetical protein n=1 Tax=Mycobacterium sp. GA-2829 TaxID=1772283 RepID=UPI0007400AC6|nr:hypothetical protein [Mycobacterium sp. GA-2829]KUI35707.1 hypothetical protein AU194_09735 [Mycobacterium sp. GA-2829]